MKRALVIVAVFLVGCSPSAAPAATPNPTPTPALTPVTAWPTAWEEGFCGAYRLMAKPLIDKTPSTFSPEWRANLAEAMALLEELPSWPPGSLAKQKLTEYFQIEQEAAELAETDETEGLMHMVDTIEVIGEVGEAINVLTENHDFPKDCGVIWPD